MKTAYGFSLEVFRPRNLCGVGGHVLRRVVAVGRFSSYEIFFLTLFLLVMSCSRSD